MVSGKTLSPSAILKGDLTNPDHIIIEFPELEDVVSPKNFTVPPKKFLMTSFSHETEEEPPAKPTVLSSIP